MDTVPVVQAVLGDPQLSYRLPVGGDGSLLAGQKHVSSPLPP